MQKSSSFSIKLFLPVFSLFILAFIVIAINKGLFTVKQIEIKNNCTQDDQLKEALNLTGRSFFSLNSSEIAENLKRRFLCIKNVVVSKSFPDKVRLQILKREPVALLINLKEQEASGSWQITEIAAPFANETDELFLTDQEGMVFAKTSDYLNIPQLFVFKLKVAVGEKLTKEIINCLEILNKVKTFGLRIEKGWTDNNDLVVFTEEKSKIIIRLNEKINVQLASLQLILSEAKIDLKEVEFIDLRFDKPVIKNAPKKNSER